MEEEHWLLILLRCRQAERVRFRVASRGAAAALCTVLDELVLDGPHDSASSSAAAGGAGRRWKAACTFLGQHPRVRRLSLRGARLTTEELGSMLAAAPGIAHCDVTFALPLSWPSYLALQRQPELRHVHFQDALAATPRAGLLPREVVIAQAYGLHAGRVDVCFRFASPSNKAATGPLERFSSFFEGPTRYRAMLGCKSFSVGPEVASDSAAGQQSKARVTLQVQFIDQDGLEHLYLWELSLQVDLPVAGCWMTDGVVPINIESMWDGSMLEE
mmetsp:Transcript_16440/g.51456  ORF Transcript_16440/g.51456 Transcript_16440/m.51456 type:complete len:273 (+) Transcript_16440:134-952(+)